MKIGEKLENRLKTKILKKIEEALDNNNTCHAIDLGKLLERIEESYVIRR